MEIVWEKIYENVHESFEEHYEATYRARVVCGWLVRHVVFYRMDNELSKEGWNRREVSMVFVPDSRNDWNDPMVEY